MIEVLKQVRQIVWRYRHETPLGNQPHLIAHEADETINRIDQAIEQAEKQEPVAVVSSVAQVGDKGVSVRWLGGFPQIGDRLYTSPPQRHIIDKSAAKRIASSLGWEPQRQWVGLTEKERNDIEDFFEMIIGKPAFDSIEAKLKEKNT